MVEQPTIDSKNFVSAKSAAELVGYTSDYIALLARQGKVVGEKVGKAWFVDLQSVRTFAERMQEHKVFQKRQLRSKRKVEYEHRYLEEAAPKVKTVGTGRRAAFSYSILIVGIGLVIGFSGYYVVPISQQGGLAAVYQEGRTVLENIKTFTTSIPASVVLNRGEESSQERWGYNITTFRDDDSTASKENVVQGAFSDTVEVLFQSEVADSGVIIPQFREKEADEYRFRLFLEPPQEER